MALNRQVEMQVISNNSLMVNMSNLFIDFDIERTLILSSNKASFTIYNNKEDTISKILKNGNNIIFKAGHEDEKNINTIFYGVITFSSSYKQNTEIVTKVTAMDLAAVSGGLNYQFFAYSYKEKTPISQVFSDIAGVLNVSLFGIENLTESLNNGFSYCGNIGGLLREMRMIIKNYELEVYLDTGSMIIYKVGSQVSKFGVVRIPSNNIIGGVENVEDSSKQDTRKRIKFNCILNPKLKPNVLVNVLGQYTSGIYITEKVHFVGDNHGGEFRCGVEAAS